MNNWWRSAFFGRMRIDYETYPAFIFLFSLLHDEIKLSGTLCVGGGNTINSLLDCGVEKRVRLIYKSCRIQLTPIESVIDIDKKRFSSWTNVSFLFPEEVKSLKTFPIDNGDTAIKIFRNYILMRLFKIVYLIQLPFQDDFLCLSSDDSIMEDCWQCDPFKDYDVIANANEPEMGYVSSSAIRST